MSYETFAAAPAADARLTFRAFLTDKDDQAVARAVGEALNIDVAAQTGTIRTAARSIDGERCPDGILVDLSGIDDELSAMEALAHVSEPHMKVIAIGEHNDIGLYRRLKGLGVTEYLYRPLTRPLLEEAIRTALNRAPRRTSERLGKLVCVAGARGGTGTTTLAVNLAAYLAQIQRRRVALADCDVAAGTCGLLLNVDPNAALREALADPGRLDAKFLERAMVPIDERLDLLGSDGERPATAGVDADAFLRVLDLVRSIYHYTIADIPAAMASSSPDILAAADMVLVVTDGSLAGSRDAARLLRNLTAAGVDGRAVLNRSGAPGQIPAADLERILGRKPDFAVPFLPGLFTDAAAAGAPAFRRKRRVAAAIGCIAQEISGRPAPRRSLLDRVFGR